MKHERILIAGCGDLGGRLGRRLVAEGRQVWGLRRSVEKLPAELRPLRGDLGAAELESSDLPPVDAVVYTASADGLTDDAYRRAYVNGVRHLLDALREVPRRWVHVSSTSVYAQSGGEEVDETSAAEPDHFGGRRLIEGEQLLHRAAAERGFTATVVRFGGIYGPERTRLLRSVRDGSARCYEPPVWTNRIHVDDCVGVLAHLLDLDAPEPVYLGVDGEPAPDGEVKRWLAERLGAPDPGPAAGPEAAPPAATPSEGSRALRSNKRCRNDRLVSSGYVFRYPDFRSGYGAIADALGWAGEAKSR